MCGGSNLVSSFLPIGQTSSAANDIARCIGKYGARVFHHRSVLSHSGSEVLGQIFSTVHFLISFANIFRKNKLSMKKSAAGKNSNFTTSIEIPIYRDSRLNSVIRASRGISCNGWAIVPCPTTRFEAENCMSVLIVDDEEVIRVLATKILQRSGQATLTADTPVNGLYLLSENLSTVNLVILDYNLPGMSGIDLLGEIRKLAPGMPCIFSSGDQLEGSEVPEEIRQNVFFLQKPYKPQELTSLVLQVIARVPSGA